MEQESIPQDIELLQGRRYAYSETDSLWLAAKRVSGWVLKNDTCTHIWASPMPACHWNQKEEIIMDWTFTDMILFFFAGQGQEIIKGGSDLKKPHQKSNLLYDPGFSPLPDPWYRWGVELPN